jgi:hypothetical protein
MGDAGEGLVDAESRVQERMEELERERADKRSGHPPNPEAADALESLRLARAELSRQLQATAHPQRQAMLTQAIAELDARRDRMRADVQAARTAAK